ncbi:MAG: hypothetical protein KJ749_04205, partial [Planctomycetes bacterium]|nr:hypothetical protein [Planctomycetota bacterium]
MADLFLVPYVRAVWQMLEHRLGTAGRMGIYGAGTHTRWLLGVTDDLPRLPIECVIDDGAEQKMLGGLAVCRPNEVDIEAIDLILISSDQWEERLVDRAREHWGDRVELVRLYEGLPAGPYDKSDDRAEVLRRLRWSSADQSIPANEVVIVSDRPGPREAKIGYGLRHAGWRTVLLHRDGPRFDTRRGFDETHAYSHAWEALRLACAYRPAAYQVMVNTDYRTAELFVQHQPGVVVVDSYDLVAGMYTDEYLAACPAFAAQI